MSKKSTVCTNCEGTGNRNRSDIDSSPQDCPHCGGTGLQDEGVVHDTDLMDKLDDTLDKCNDILCKCNDIFEKVSE